MSKKKIDYKEDEDIDINACSAMDCTGLIPSLPQSEAELESYQDICKYEANLGKEGTE